MALVDSMTLMTSKPPKGLQEAHYTRQTIFQELPPVFERDPASLRHLEEMVRRAKQRRQTAADAAPAIEPPRRQGLNRARSFPNRITSMLTTAPAAAPPPRQRRMSLPTTTPQEELRRAPSFSALRRSGACYKRAAPPARRGPEGVWEYTQSPH